MGNQKHKTSLQVWRLVNLVMASFFGLAAYVNTQINDDDWYVWVPIYAVPALLSVSAVIKPNLTESQSWRSLVALDFIASLLYGIYQMFALLKVLVSNIKNPLVYEEGREISGLIIILTWTGIARFVSIERNKTNVSLQRSGSAIFWIILCLAIIPLFTWSLCFIGDWHKHLGHCNNMFQK